MSKQYRDINDDEIRIIGRESRGLTEEEDCCGAQAQRQCASRNPSEASGVTHKNPRKYWYIAVAAVVAVVIVIALATRSCSGAKDDAGANEELVLVKELSPQPMKKGAASQEEAEATQPVATPSSRGYVERTDTVVNGAALTIFRPYDAVPKLVTGTLSLADSANIFIVQAADVRKDNGEIVGAYVKEGQLISKGERKPGYCAIIGGNITIGVADATPLLEQAIETDGYFFRQYPLVVANQIVENKNKGESLRRALAELDGQIVVVMSRRRMSFHDFSQGLVDLGVSNAIYLVGAYAYGYAVDKEGGITEFGTYYESENPYINYIVWQ